MLVPSLASADEMNGLRCSVASTADANGDGCPDVAVAARRREVQSEANLPGRVWILSACTGELLRTLEGPPGCSTFGSALEDVGDVDGDGATDLGVVFGNRVRVFSGKDGSVLHDLGGVLGGTGAGTSVSGGHDVDADGRHDIAVFRTTSEGGEFEADEWPEVFGIVEIYSGKTGQLLRAIAGPEEPRTVQGDRQGRLASGRLTPAFALVADRNSDGRAELALTFSDDEPDESKAGGMLLVVIDPWSLESFVRTPIPPLGQGCPWIIREIGDLDGDEAPDLLLSVIEDYTLALSGRTGAELRQHSYAGGYLYAEGSSLDVVGDLNHDGTPDYLVAANEDSLDCDPGFVVVHSGADGSALGSLGFKYKEGQQSTNGSGGSWTCGPGADACAIGDVDGDGQREIAVHVPRLSELRVLSGATFEEILRIGTEGLLRRKPAAPR